MTTAHQRKKDPEGVRRALLDSAIRITAEQGMVGLTVQAVAAAAGVTKGGLFHHFENKQSMVDALFLDLLEQMDRQIESLLEQDEREYGRFTRAYVKNVFDVLLKGGDGWMALGIASVMEPRLQKFYESWFLARLARHADTDDAPALEIVRLAADGAWLAYMARTHHALLPDTAYLRQNLLDMTLLPRRRRGAGAATDRSGVIAS